MIDLQCFDFIDEKVPEGWMFQDLKNGSYRLQPKEFGDDFWDDFHDGNEAAEKVFQEVERV